MISQSTRDLANAINKFKDDASTSTESQILEAWKMLQNEGLSKDIEVIFLRIENQLLKEKIKNHAAKNTSDNANQ